MHIAKNSPHLTSLKTKFSNITDVSIKAIAENCPDLTNINFSNNLNSKNISDASIKMQAGKCSNITMINLSECPNITDASVVALAKKFKNLTSIDLSGCAITIDSLTGLLENCSKLNFISIRDYDLYSSNSENSDIPGIPDDIFKLVKKREILFEM